jgi:hypothetical protein
MPAFAGRTHIGTNPTVTRMGQPVEHVYTAKIKLECWYYVSGIASSFVALGGLIGLAVYAFDTRRLRIAAQQQLETAIRPCVLLMEDADALRDFDHANLILKNAGGGGALNVRWRYKIIADSDWIGCPALAPGEFIRPPVHPRDLLDGNGIECEFTSLSDTRYRATVTCGTPGPGLELQHKVELVKG